MPEEAQEAIDEEYERAKDFGFNRDKDLEKRIRLLEVGQSPKEAFLDMFYEEKFEFVVNYDFKKFDQENEFDANLSNDDAQNGPIEDNTDDRLKED